MQALLQPSPLSRLPSSQLSGAITLPSPQIAADPVPPPRAVDAPVACQLVFVPPPEFVVLPPALGRPPSSPRLPRSMLSVQANRSRQRPVVIGSIEGFMTVCDSIASK